MKNGCLELHVNLRHSNLLCVLAIGLMGSAAASATPVAASAMISVFIVHVSSCVSLALRWGLDGGPVEPFSVK